MPLLVQEKEGVLPQCWGNISPCLEVPPGVECVPAQYPPGTTVYRGGLDAKIAASAATSRGCWDTVRT